MEVVLREWIKAVMTAVCCSKTSVSALCVNWFIFWLRIKVCVFMLSASSRSERDFVFCFVLFCAVSLPPAGLACSNPKKRWKQKQKKLVMWSCRLHVWFGLQVGWRAGCEKTPTNTKKNHFFNFLVALLVDFIWTIGLNLILCQSPSFPCFPALWNNDNGNYKIACLFKWTLTEITQRIPSLFYILLIFLCVAWRMSVLSCCHTGLDEERPLCCCGSDIKVCSCSHRFHLQSLCH